MAASITLAVSTVIFALRPHPDTGHLALWLPLVRRIRSPHKGHWALPGGPLRADEDLAASAGRNLRDTTALTPRYLEQLFAFGRPDRSADRAAPQNRTVSIVYWALVHADVASAGVESDNVHWFLAEDVPTLAFDHNQIIEYALWRLRNKMEYSRIAAAFLGDTFTLSELREVHEVVLERTLDPANFRRQIETARDVISTDEFRMGGRHRPARLYRHNHSIELADNGPLTGR
ncbi:NUDIX hydrolase [Paramicrobacterium fandaimingii]|uniref:NUDIX hydrolase n=1 Tax=Paramicrobacterium fandaimingii TaxID=2708079 RepID=UPI0014237876|nr:NUDIX domain-containing protein [Microbacterium fandaimingii]